MQRFSITNSSAFVRDAAIALTLVGGILRKETSAEELKALDYGVTDRRLRVSLLSAPARAGIESLVKKGIAVSSLEHLDKVGSDMEKSLGIYPDYSLIKCAALTRKDWNEFGVCLANGSSGVAAQNIRFSQMLNNTSYLFSEFDEKTCNKAKKKIRALMWFAMGAYKNIPSALLPVIGELVVTAIKVEDFNVLNILTHHVQRMSIDAENVDKFMCCQGSPVVSEILRKVTKFPEGKEFPPAKPALWEAPPPLEITTHVTTEPEGIDNIVEMAAPKEVSPDARLQMYDALAVLRQNLVDINASDKQIDQFQRMEALWGSLVLGR